MPLEPGSHSSNSPSPALRRAGGVLAFALCLTAAIAIWALVTGSFDATATRVVLSTVAAALCTLCGLTGSAVLERQGYRRSLGLATIALAVVDLAVALALTWTADGGDGETLWRVLGVASALLFALSHSCLMLAWLRRRKSRVAGSLAKIAVAFAAAAALLVSGLFAFARGPVDPAIWRGLGVLVVLTLLTTVLTPLLHRIAKAQRTTTEPSR